MEYRRLGHTDIEVSVYCLGSMTWGSRNSEAEAYRQLDTALAAGINFIDNAEMYPTPPKQETWGRTEEILGNWLAARRNRDRVFVATKVIGPAEVYAFVRGALPRLDRANIVQAVDDSLRRLKTDYVDLYQLHWPDRRLNRHGRSGLEHPAEDDVVPLAETLEVFDGLVRTGKIRYAGVSNETAWGVMAYEQLAELHGWPRMVSIQNRYNLLEREFEHSLAEVAIRERCGLLAFSPLGGGALSGKYLDGTRPTGSRYTLPDTPDRYLRPKAEAAIWAYVELARHHGLDPTAMALAFARTRPFLTSVIIGATDLDQLETCLASADLVLTPELVEAIDGIHAKDPAPCG